MTIRAEARTSQEQLGRCGSSGTWTPLGNHVEVGPDEQRLICSVQKAPPGETPNLVYGATHNWKVVGFNTGAGGTVNGREVKAGERYVPRHGGPIFIGV